EAALFGGKPDENEPMAPRLTGEALIETGQQRGAAPVVDSADAHLGEIEVGAYDDRAAALGGRRGADDVRLLRVWDRLGGEPAAFATDFAEERFERGPAVADFWLDRLQALLNQLLRERVQFDANGIGAERRDGQAGGQ